MSKGKKTDLKVFQRYLNKEMNEGEEHAFEMHMLNDAFESEALEGFSTLTVEDLNAELFVLNNKLKRKKVISWRKSYFMAAASILLGIGLISLLWIFVPEEPLRVSETVFPAEHIEKSIAEKNPKIVFEAEEKEEKTEESAEVQVAGSEEIINEKADRPKRNFAFKPVEEIILAEEIGYKLEFYISEEDRISEEMTKVDYGTLHGELLNGNSGSASLVELKVIHGKVMDKDKHPIAGANVHLTGTHVATVTRADGYYEMKVPLTDSSKLVAADFIGYLSQEVAQNSEDSLNFIMEEAQYALSEVVTVTTVSKDKKRRVNEFVPARPEGGMDAYLKSIEKALHYPKSWRGKKELVVVLVTISDSGEIKNIKVKRSPSEDYSVEVIRAIRSGAKWQAATDNGLPSKDKVKLKINFRPKY